jgi:hypothetical protein
MPLQQLTLTLDGITAGDYLTWVRDPEPAALGRELHSIELRADPLGDTMEALLSWNAAPPDAAVAAASAGLPLTPEVVSVTALTTPQSSERMDSRFEPRARRYIRHRIARGDRQGPSASYA